MFMISNTFKFKLHWYYDFSVSYTNHFPAVLFVGLWVLKWQQKGQMVPIYVAGLNTMMDQISYLMIVVWEHHLKITKAMSAQ